MMRLNNLLPGCMIFGLLLSACDSKDRPKAATTDAASPGNADAAKAAPRLLPAPPGDPGPVLVHISGNFPTQIFAAAATLDSIAFAMQSDVRDVTLCTQTELPVCFQGNAVIAQRRNPNQPKVVKLYESDTQSGSRVDDLAAAGNRFVFALNEGRYVGDTPAAKLVVIDESANNEREIVLSGSDIRIDQMTLNTLDDDRVLVCKSYEQAPGKHGLICEKLDPASGKLTPVATIQTQHEVRSFEIGVHEENILAVWNESGAAHAAYLHATHEILELGISTALKPHIAAGLDDFTVVWQSDDAQTHVEKIPFSASLKSMERQSLVLNGLDYRSIDGLAAVSQGYLFAFRHQNTQQMALVQTDFKSWHLLSNSNHWRMLSNFASIDIQEAHTGNMIWQTAESLVGIQ